MFWLPPFNLETQHLHQTKQYQHLTVQLPQKTFDWNKVHAYLCKVTYKAFSRLFILQKCCQAGAVRSQIFFDWRRRTGAQNLIQEEVTHLMQLWRFLRRFVHPAISILGRTCLPGIEDASVKKSSWLEMELLLIQSPLLSSYLCSSYTRMEDQGIWK